MGSVLIAAIISASISLIGFIINLFIAKETRRSTMDSIKFSLAIKSKENILNEIKKLCTETEKMRITCWNVIMFLQKYKSQSCFRDNQVNDYINEIIKLKKSFSEQFSIFFESWSTVKGTIPEDITLIISFLRHETKNIVLVVCNYLDILEHDLNSVENRGERTMQIMTVLNTNLNNLPSKLDTIFSRANDVRNNMIIEFMTLK